MFDLDRLMESAEREATDDLPTLSKTAEGLQRCTDPGSRAAGERMVNDIRRIRKLIAVGKWTAAKKIIFAHLIAQQIGWAAA